MKALSVAQPWAHLILSGAKRFDVRSWKTVHRGPLLIHAAKSLSEAARTLCSREPYRRLLSEAGIKHASDLPRGLLLGVVDLDDCVPTEELLYANAAADELALANFTLGHWAWRLGNPRFLKERVPYKGKLGIFDVPEGLLQ